MVPEVIFQPTGLRVGLAVWPAFRHQVSLVQFVEEHITALRFFNGIINPNFTLRNKLIHVIVAAFGEVNVKYTPHQSPVDNPDAYAIFESLPEAFMNLARVRQLLSAVGESPDIPGPAAFLSFRAVGFNDGLSIRHPFCHQAVLNKEMLDEETAFVMMSFLINP